MYVKHNNIVVFDVHTLLPIYFGVLVYRVHNRSFKVQWLLCVP